MNFIENYIAKKVLDELYQEIKTLYFDDKNYKIISHVKDTILALESHYKYLLNWSRILSFRDMKENKELNDLYVGLQIKLTPRKWSAKLADKIETFTIKEIVNTTNNLVLLGNPGAGKTTTLKFLCNSLLFDEKNDFPYYKFPILIQLRTLEYEETIFDRLKTIFGIELYFNGDKSAFRNLSNPKERKIFEDTIIHFVDSLNIIVLVDGLDEIPLVQMQKAVNQLEKLTLSLQYSRIILTCRSGIFDSLIENTKVYEICNLDNEQIICFAQNWFKEQSIIEDFLFNLNKSPYKDTSVNPLLLTLLCSLYEKYKEIPPKPKSVYKKIVRMAIEDWDSQRQIKRKSMYSNFDTDAKLEFLEHFAYKLTILFQTRSYSEDNFLQVYRSICDSFGLPQKDMRKAIKEIESHNGIIVQSSYDDYEYAHKSIQEYLTAEYIIKLGYVPIKEFHDLNLANELAIATALSSNPNSYFDELFNSVFIAKSTKRHIIEEYLHRVSLEKPLFVPDITILIHLINVYFRFYLNPNEWIPNEIYFQNYSYGQPSKFPIKSSKIEFDSDDYVEKFIVDTPFSKDFYNLETSELEKYYLNIFEKLLELPAFKESFSLLGDKIEKVKLTKKLIRYDIKSEVNSKINQVILHKEMDLI